MRCGCGERTHRSVRDFEFVFWHDGLDVLRKRGVGQPPYPIRAWVQNICRIDGGALLNWFNTAISAMAGDREQLPTLYQIWARNDHGGLASECLYFVQRRPSTGLDHYFRVESHCHELSLIESDHPSALSWLGRLGLREPPRLGERIDVLSSAKYQESHHIDAAWVEGLLWDTPLRLQKGDPLTFFERDIEEARGVLQHFATNAEPIWARYL
jgi:hypothetical protein